MLRRNVRLRKEYLLKKSLQDKDAQIKNRKSRIKAALSEGKPIAPEDRDFELENRADADLENEVSLRPVSAIDNEYAYAGIKDPKIILTTSRHPSNRLMQFVKELNLLFPNSFRINRGTYVIKDIVKLGQTREVSDIIIAHEHRGVPSSLVLCHLPLGPTFYFQVKNVVLRHDLPEAPPPMSTAPPHLIFHNFSSKIDFDVENEDAGAHSGDDKNSDKKILRDLKLNDQIKLVEIGPRFELKLYRIELGTPDMIEAEVEWSLKMFLNKPKEALA